MKKIYSIIAVASMMLTTVFGFTSCQKDEMPNPQKVQTVQPSKNPLAQVPSSSTTTPDGTTFTVTNTDKGSKSHLTFVESQTVKVDDTSYVVGEWTATVDGTDYTFVVSNNSAKDRTDVIYKATLKVGDQAYDGEYSASLNKYSGIFDSAEKTADNHYKAQLDFVTFDKSNLNEFTADIFISNKSIADNVKFVKK